MLSDFAGRALLGALVLLQGGPQIPPPRGMVNDFANALPEASIARMERVVQDVRAKSSGEIAIVTLSDLGGRDPSDIALRIGREWKVGNMAAIGDRSRNAGVVILLVPKETSSDGRATAGSRRGRVQKDSSPTRRRGPSVVRRRRRSSSGSMARASKW